MFRVVQAFVQSGHAPEEISNAVNDRFYKRRFRVAEGDLNERRLSLMPCKAIR